MSQQLTPIDGGVLEVQTSLSNTTFQVVSTPYIEVKNLQPRLTEWSQFGRPIYRRLPAGIETADVELFNLDVIESEADVRELTEVGYVYIPWGLGYSGPESLELVRGESPNILLLKAGTIVWKHGPIPTLPTIIDLQILDVVTGVYGVSYQLFYDDDPRLKLYSVEDYSLSGVKMDIKSSTDGIIGWRYPAVNAFLSETEFVWKNEDTYFPTFSQPTSAYLEWSTQYTQSYSAITLNSPPGKSFSGTASLYYVRNGVDTPVTTVTLSSTSTFTFRPESPSFETGWKIVFSDTTVSVSEILVTGVVTLLEFQAAPSSRAVLVMYPANSRPPGTYVDIAEVEVGRGYQVDQITDQRIVIRQDFVPVADWLTYPFDENLIDLYNQVSDYDTVWMAPPSAMLQEYAGLTDEFVEVEGQ